MLRSVMPVRAGRQLSSSVSTETTTSVCPGETASVILQPISADPSVRGWGPALTELRHPIEAPQPRAAPSRPKHNQLMRVASGRSPLPLVGLISPQKIETSKPPLYGPTNHARHEHPADALPLPLE